MRELLPVLLVLFLLLTAALATAVGIVWWMSGAAGQTVGAVLIYEIDPRFEDNPMPVDVQKVVAAIDRRINPRWSSRARVRALPNGRIEVAVFGNDPQVVGRIKRLLQSAGTLEFRILANQHDHKVLIEQAQSESSEKLLNEAGDLLGWWVPVKAGNESNFHSSGEIAKRTRKQGDGEVLEVLVVKDSFDVTGAYLEYAQPHLDSRGEPSIQFRFNANGARLFGGLTGSNLPNPIMMDFSRKLGIILNGRLVSAPAIQSTITNRGVITGSFTKQEVRDLAAVLNAGPMPLAIRQVEKRSGDTGQ